MDPNFLRAMRAAGLLPDEGAPPPPPDAGLDAALADDRKAAEQNFRRSAADEAALYIAGRGADAARRGTPKMERPSAVQAWALKQKATQDAEDRPFERFSKIAAAQKAMRGNSGDRPAPTEWGASPGMSVDEAIRAGYGHAAKPKGPPAPDAILEAIAQRDGISGAEADALRDRPDEAFKIYERTPKASPEDTLPTEEQIARHGPRIGKPLPGETAIKYQARADAFATRGDAKAEREAARGDKREERGAAKSARLNIGKSWTAGPAPVESLPVIAELTKRNLATETLMRETAALRQSFSGPGSIAAGKKATQLQTFSRFVQMQLKDAWGLGVLNGKDFELLNSVISNPAEAGNILRDQTAFRAFNDQLDAFENMVQTQMHAQATEAGFLPAKGSRYEEKAPSAGATVTVIWKGKPKTIPAEKLDEALKAGATRAP